VSTTPKQVLDALLSAPEQAAPPDYGKAVPNGFEFPDWLLEQVDARHEAPAFKYQKCNDWLLNQKGHIHD